MTGNTYSLCTFLFTFEIQKVENSHDREMDRGRAFHARQFDWPGGAAWKRWAGAFILEEVL